MAEPTSIIFWEKPGCIGNQRQKAFLRQQGLALDVRDLLSASWTAAELLGFFTNKPVSEWFNPSAPDIKQGDIDPTGLSEAAALVLLLEQPLLIRRPLLAYGPFKQSGFDHGAVFQALSIQPEAHARLDSCPVDLVEPDCEAMA